MNVSRNENYYVDQDPVVLLFVLEDTTQETVRSIHNCFINMGNDQNHIHYIYNPDSGLGMVKVEPGDKFTSAGTTNDNSDMEVSMYEVIQSLHTGNYEMFWYDMMYHGPVGTMSDHPYLENHQVEITEDKVIVKERLTEDEAFVPLIEFPYK